MDCFAPPSLRSGLRTHRNGTLNVNLFETFTITAPGLQLTAQFFVFFTVHNSRLSVDKLARPRYGTTVFVLLIIWCLLSGQTKAPEYLFPLAMEPAISGTFGEYRGYRFHAGIDLRTNGVMGYPVKATGDGEVFQVKHFVGADGKVLYLRHRTGQITVYAHLFEFMPALEKLVQEERRRTNRYGFRLWPEKPLRVNKGTIIGYSGKSGTSSPHLHFEIRTPDNQPLNPFKKGLLIADVIPPVLKSITLEPADPYSAVEGGSASRSFNFVQRGGGYVLAKRPRVAGQVQITLGACDETTPGSCNGVYRIEVYRGSGLPGLSLSFDKFSFLDNFKGLSVYQTGSNFFQGRYLYRLVPAPSACNPFLRNPPHPLWLRGIGARGPLLIKVYDAADNFAIGKVLLEEDPGAYDFSDQILKYPFFIKAGEKKALSIDKGSFKLEFSPESLCSPDYLAIQEKREGEGTVYSARFKDNSSAQRIKVAMELTNRMRLDKVGIYARASAEQGWTYLPTVVDRKSHYACAYSTLPGDFTLKEDDSKPVIGPEIYYGKARNLINLNRYEISCSLYDYGSGLDPDSISFRVDNEPMFWELNYPEQRLYCYLREPLPAGSHQLYLKAADRIGNISEYQGTFLAPDP